MKLTYFDIDGGRGEAARLAMSIGGVAFEDYRMPFPRFREERETLPFRKVPILEVNGEALTQSIAINRYVGKLAGLYPEDPWQAALADEAMGAVEDVSTATTASFSIKDDAEKKAARVALIEFPISVYLKALSQRLDARGDYFADGRLTVADLSVFVWTRHLASGTLDHVPTDVVETHGPALARHRKRIGELPGVAAYYEGRK